jgi:hypothetical protein
VVGRKWGPRPGDPPNAKKYGQDVQWRRSQIGTGKVLYPNPYGTAKTLLLGRVSHVERKHASKIKNISQINIKI